MGGTIPILLGQVPDDCSRIRRSCYVAMIGNDNNLIRKSRFIDGLKVNNITVASIDIDHDFHSYSSPASSASSSELGLPMLAAPNRLK